MSFKVSFCARLPPALEPEAIQSTERAGACLQGEAPLQGGKETKNEGKE